MLYRHLLIAGCCIAWLAGILLGGWSAAVSGWLWPGLLAALAGVLVRRRRLPAAALLLAALLLAGIGRAEGVKAPQQELSALVGQTVTVEGQVTTDPVTLKSQTFAFRLERLNGQPASSTIWISTYPQRLQRGFHLELQGKVKPGFGTYPAELSYPKTLVIDTRQNWLERLRQRFFAGMRTALPEPVASFALGLLVGVRALIPKPLQAQLARTGLSHLVAVSGYNLTIIAQASQRLSAGLGYNLSAVLTLWLLAGFVVLTGAPASIVRAAVVAVLVIMAGRYGRRVPPINLLLAAAALTAAWNPGYLSDLGWLLSFAAFYGIAVLAPAVERRLGLDGEVITPGAGLTAPGASEKVWGGWRTALVKLLIESTCAQLMTLPILMHSFNQLSVIAPLANLVILPLVPLLMLLGLMAGVAGMLLPAFCGWVAWPALLLTGGTLGLVGWFDGLSFASFTQGLSAADAVWMYLVMAALTAALWAWQRRAKPAIPVMIHSTDSKGGGHDAARGISS